MASATPQFIAIIRYFTELCKQQFHIFTDGQLFDMAYAAFKPREAVCPYCRAHTLEIHSQYTRGLFSSTGKNTVAIHRYRCVLCEKTHALLPDIIIPYSRYSLHFRLKAVQAYAVRRGSVEVLCADLGIAISTLYRWLKLLKSHKSLYLGRLNDNVIGYADFVRFLLNEPALSAILRRFFRFFNLSFWQARTTCSRPRPPNTVLAG